MKVFRFSGVHYSFVSVGITVVLFFGMVLLLFGNLIDSAGPVVIAEPVAAPPPARTREDDWAAQSLSPGAGAGKIQLGCDGIAEKPLREIPSGGIVKWTDEDGITHYEDYHGEAPPDGLEVVTRFAGTRQYFFLNIESDSGALPAKFRAAISAKSIWLYERYRALLDERFLSRASLNLVVYSNKTGYETVREQYVGGGAEDVPGFYIVSLNRAEILSQGDDEQTLKVMLHEVVHVINNQLFGQLPRWLNEGLATYMESQDRDERRPATAKERLRVIKRQVGLPLLDRVDVSQLLKSDNAPWGAEERTIYYPFAQLLTTYLLQPENRDFARTFFNYLAAHKCEDHDVAGYIDRYYPGGINGLSAGFIHWLTL